MTVAPVIEVDQLRHSFGSTVAVDGVSFTAAAGSVLGVLGRNGAGKTTIINCLTTLLRPDSGRAVVAGCDVRDDPAGVRARIALTGQNAAVDEVLSGRDNLVLFGRLLGLSKSAARARADELLGRFGLQDAAGRPVGSYSGGMRRRLDLAVSLVVERPVMFLDEPTTGLDPQSRQELWAVIRDLRAAGRTILLTTQYLEEADNLADAILVLDHGRVIAEGSPDELKERVGGAACHVEIADPAVRARAADALRRDFADVAEADGALVVPAGNTGLLTEVVRALDSAGVQADNLGLRRPTLDDAFFALTGRYVTPEEAAQDAKDAKDEKDRSPVGAGPEGPR
jgi:ABC-2 type transport system ATP-binding protein